MSEQATRADVSISQVSSQGMITLRGELGAPSLTEAVRAATGLSVPQQRQIVGDGDRAGAWMSPDELLLLVPYADAAALAAKLSVQLQASHALVTEVSDARALFVIEGAGAREVLAKLAPVDLAPGRFEPGVFRRTRLAQVPCAFWMPEPDIFHLIAFRSVADYVADLLQTAACSGGEVAYF